MKTNRTAPLLCCLTTLLILITGTGCEDNGNGPALVVTPPQAELTGIESVTFSVTRENGAIASLPLTWLVENAALGQFTRTTGNQAVYQANGTPGPNVITVTDANGQEGFVFITQSP